MHPKIQREIAERYHRGLTEDIRAFLRERGIPDVFIDDHLLGWNGERITIPILDLKQEVVGFRYAKRREDGGIEMISGIGLETQLYGWESLARARSQVVICARELDRLVLEANGFPAVASTGGAQTFLAEWVPYFEKVQRIYICFDRDLRGSAAAKKVQSLLPKARIVTLPPEVGQSGGITDFFVSLRNTPNDFRMLLARTECTSAEQSFEPPAIALTRVHDKTLRRRLDRARRDVRLHDVVANFTDLQVKGDSWVGRCPFHPDPTRSFTVYRNDTYRCAACTAEGDVARFLIEKESMTLEQALDALERFQLSHELYGTAA